VILENQERLSMGETVKQQIKSGLRVGSGIGSLMIAVIFLGDGLRRVWLTTVPHHFSFSGLGCIELLLAATILLATAHLWLPYFAGCMVLGVLQGVLMLLTGQGLYTHRALPRLESAGFVLFCIATIALIVRPLMGRTTILDRVALTLYVFSFPSYAMHNFKFSITDPLMVGGPALLLVSWCVERWKGDGRRNEGRAGHIRWQTGRFLK
jgi:hypothetical protein